MPTAERQVERVPQHDISLLDKAIVHLEHDPRRGNVKKLAGKDLWRIRAGAYRLVYSVDDAERLVVIVRVARRSESTYKEL